MNRSWRGLALAGLVASAGCEQKADPGASDAVAEAPRSAGVTAPGTSAAATSATAAAPSAAASASVEADKAAIGALVSEHKKAIYARDGDKAAALVAEPTIVYFESVRKDALAAPEADLRKKPLVDRLMILIIRARVDVERLRQGDGKSLFAYAVKEGMVGEEARTLEPGDVEVEGDMAKVGVRMGAQTLPPEVGFRAYREQGAWKLHLMSVMKLAGPALEQQLKGIDPDPDAAMIKVLETLLGRKVGAEIWQPLDPPKK
jgi:hypothetical protein